MVSTSFFTDGPTNTGSVVAPEAPAAFYADPAAAAASAQQAADAAATAAASASAASTAAAAAAASVGGKANIDSPTFTGVPAAPTPSNGDNSTRLATTAWVQANAVGSSPATAAPLMDGTAAVGVSAKYAREDHKHPTDTSRASVSYVDAQIASVASVSYVDAQDATKAPLASPAFTGNPTAPTPSVGDNTTKVATTAFVLSNSFQSINIQTFTASGTYTPSTNLAFAIIECVGGGGGGGGVAGAGANIGLAAGGGGGAGYAKVIAPASSIGASQTVTIGAAGTAGAAGNNAGGSGGSTSVGLLCAAAGGAGGTSSSGVSSIGGSAAGGSGVTGAIKLSGCSGGGGSGTSNYTTSQAFYTGAGGAAAAGFSGEAVTSTGAAAGTAGIAYGGGGSGATTIDTTSRAGGAGAPGIVVITEYIR